MAGMKDIKTRIKSVESTKQITKAMELVASSKFIKAKDSVECSRPYFETLYDTVQSIAKNTSGNKNIFLKQREVKNTCYIVIAGDRGLAGGYNSSVFKVLYAHSKGKNAYLVPVGKKATEISLKKTFNALEGILNVEGATYEDSSKIATLVMDKYKKGEIDEVNVIYTQFVSALTQEAKLIKLLPITVESTTETKGNGAAVQYLPSPEAVLGNIIPNYVSGTIYGAISESYASEQAARRTAMESATDNADEMISKLELIYNRARQAAVTQEISEIVAGASSAKK